MRISLGITVVALAVGTSAATARAGSWRAPPDRLSRTRTPPFLSGSIGRLT
ncbi:MAG TPA: hypothetical protein VMU39_10670 [Solirubrobacteraceae bacterium]|nr:hypothetical protein [Solirubrobacteraceae bacterium]